MVRGIDIFTKYFAGYEEQYVIIGGTACAIHEEGVGLIARATKDIDIILVIEALTPDFAMQFWQFIKDGEYNTRQRGNGKNEYFRFLKPKQNEFPQQIELFSRKPDILKIAENTVLTPIPLDEDLSSLSAILMNDEYYNFTLEHSNIENGIRIANVESLICLKVKAFLDLSSRKAGGAEIDSKSIKKHKNDIFRLAAMLSENDSFKLYKGMIFDFRQFCKNINGDLPEQNLFNNMGLPMLKADEAFKRLLTAFNENSKCAG